MIELIPCAEEHRWLLHDWRDDPAVRRFMAHPQPIPRAVHDAWYSRLLEGEDRVGRVIVEDGHPRGAAFVSEIDRDHRRGSLGMYLGDAGARGRGVGAAALYLVMGVAFDQLALHKLTCEVLADNTGARSLYDGYGFRYEGTLHDHLLRSGTYTDMDLLAAFAADWGEIRAAAGRRLRSRGLIP